MKKYASADVIARAFVTACDILGADPLEIYTPGVAFGAQGLPIIRARYLAWHAVVAVLPEIDKTALARGLGWGKSSGQHSNICRAVRTNWWREDWLDEVVGAMLAHFAPEMAEAVVRADRTAEEESAPAPKPPTQQELDTAWARVAPLVGCDPGFKDTHLVAEPAVEQLTSAQEVMIIADCAAGKDAASIARALGVPLAPVEAYLTAFGKARPKPVRRKQGFVTLGEPAPGRSALDRRRAGLAEGN